MTKRHNNQGANHNVRERQGARYNGREHQPPRFDGREQGARYNQIGARAGGRRTPGPGADSAGIATGSSTAPTYTVWKIF